MKMKKTPNPQRSTPNFRKAAQEWTTAQHDEGVVKCGEEVIGVAVDARNAERFILAHNMSLLAEKSER
jgi:hypothetical protein